MKKFSMALFVILTVLFVSCGDNEQKEEIERSMEQLLWRLERLEEITDNPRHAKEFIESQKWYVEELNNSTKRLMKELNDIFDAEGESYSEKEVGEALGIVYTLTGESETLIENTGNHLDQYQGEGTADIQNELSMLLNESKKFKLELDRLKGQLNNLETAE
ncbi:MAG: hypothetical protein ACLFR2_08640 [Candidatus Kapaibacterium sp.]